MPPVLRRAIAIIALVACAVALVLVYRKKWSPKWVASRTTAGHEMRCAPGCDVSNDVSAQRAFSRTSNSEVDPTYVIVGRDQRIPGLVSFWVQAIDANSQPLGIMYACCLYRRADGLDGPAASVMADLGWSSASAEKRIELAKTYDDVVLQKIGGMGPVVTKDSPYLDAFDSASPFVAPEAHSLPEGGVVLRHWSSSVEMTIAGPGPVNLNWLELRFDDQGALDALRWLAHIELKPPRPAAPAPRYLIPGAR